MSTTSLFWWAASNMGHQGHRDNGICFWPHKDFVQFKVTAGVSWDQPSPSWQFLPRKEGCGQRTVVLG